MQIRTISLLLSLILGTGQTFASDKSNNMQIAVKAQKLAPIKIIFAQLGKSQDLGKITKLIFDDLQLSGQFAPEIKNIEKIYTKPEFKALFENGYGLVVFLDKLNNNTYELRLYDTSEHEMLLGKKFKKDPEISQSAFAHKISDAIWPALTNQKSSFATVVAACKKVKPKHKNEYFHVYTFYPTELTEATEPGNKKLLVNSPTMNIMPRWNPKQPILYFSQHTPTNVRLVSVDTYKNQRVVANFDGLNMTPAFSQGGSIVISITKDGHGILCKYHYNEKNKKGVFKGITSRELHAISPSFIDENRVVFCLIKDKRPSIAILDLKSKIIEQITTGFCCAPAYSKEKNSIAYCKKSDGFMQIFVYNLKTGGHKQITFDKTDKDECSWSPCGNFIIFSAESNSGSRIALVNTVSGKVSYLTPENESWEFPCWAPNYPDNYFM